MPHAANLDGVRIGAAEKEPVVANSRAKFFSALESLHVARAPIPQSYPVTIPMPSAAAARPRSASVVAKGKLSRMASAKYAAS
jgi:hypothetical protein